MLNLTGLQNNKEIQRDTKRYKEIQRDTKRLQRDYKEKQAKNNKK